MSGNLLRNILSYGLTRILPHNFMMDNYVVVITQQIGFYRNESNAVASPTHQYSSNGAISNKVQPSAFRNIKIYHDNYTYLSSSSHITSQDIASQNAASTNEAKTSYICTYSDSIPRGPGVKPIASAYKHTDSSGYNDFALSSGIIDLLNNYNDRSKGSSHKGKADNDGRKLDKSFYQGIAFMNKKCTLTIDHFVILLKSVSFFLVPLFYYDKYIFIVL